MNKKQKQIKEEDSGMVVNHTGDGIATVDPLLKKKKKPLKEILRRKLPN